MAKLVVSVLSKTENEALQKLEKIRGIVNYIQIDVMDGEFTQNKIFSTKEELSKIKWDGFKEIHLMVKDPVFYFKICEELKFDKVIFHIESVVDSLRLMRMANDKFIIELQKYHFKKGIAINPKTAIDEIQKFLPFIDTVLFMTVNPGYSGQTIIKEVFEKIRIFKTQNPSKQIEIDGGVNLENIKLGLKVGVDFFVVGSAIFNPSPFRHPEQMTDKTEQDIQKTILEFNNLLANKNF